MPLPASLRAHDYSSAELTLLHSTTKYIFATPPHPHPHSNAPATGPMHHSRPRPPLRTSSTFSAFNIYPTSTTHFPINHLLWTSVNAATYNPVQAHPLFGAHAFVLGLPPELYDFLSSVTLHEMHTAIIDFLVLLHHQLQTDGDMDGIAKMAEDLVPHVWRQVECNVGVFPNGEPDTGTRARILEHLVQISFMTPWRVDIFGAYLTDHDITVSELHHDEIHPANSTLGAVMSKLYEDWAVFRTLLCDGLGLPCVQAAEAMERAVHARKGGGLLDQVGALVKCGATVGSWFQRVPTEVLEECIAPWVVKRGCEMIAPRRRKLASLKSLLEMSTQYLEELRAEALPVELEEETEDMVAALLAEAGGEVTIGERVGVGLLTSRVLEDAAVEVETVVEMESVEMNVEEEVGRFSVDGNVVYPLDEVAWEMGEGEGGRICRQRWSREISESSESESGMSESDSGASSSSSSSSTISGLLGCEREDAEVQNNNIGRSGQ